MESIVAAGLDVTEHRRQEEEIRASRGRIVAAGVIRAPAPRAEFTDGAQQRLVSLSLALRLAQAKLGTDPAAVPEILAGASDELALALEELRELARGIHPAVLSDRGLDAALEGLAARTLCSLRSSSSRSGGACRADEAAAWRRLRGGHECRQARAGATCVRAVVEAVNGHVAIEVADDGVGGADATGSGLRGLADRLDALEGRLTIASDSGKGTRVLAEIPLPAGVAAAAAMRVVLAVDSVLLREVIARLLVEAGFDVVVQADNQELVLLKVRSHSPDVAIVDIRCRRPTLTRACVRCP